MNMVLKIVIPILPVFTMGCNTGAVTANRSLLNTLQKKNSNLELQISSLRERLLVLESRGTASRPSQVAAVKRQQPVRTEEPGPGDLPVVRLRPKAPDVAPPDSSRSSGESRSRWRKRGTTPKRVSLKLTGHPAEDRVIREPSPRRSPKILPLGKFHAIKEPGEVAKYHGAAATEPKALYERAMKHFKGRRFAHALTWFGKLVRVHPDSSYVDNAVFWQGECYYNMSKYSLAMVQYRTVIKKYGTKNKAPDAMFKLGLSYYKLGHKKSGRKMLAKVMELYPSSQVAVRASKVLESMRD